MGRLPLIAIACVISEIINFGKMLSKQIVFVIWSITSVIYGMFVAAILIRGSRFISCMAHHFQLTKFFESILLSFTWRMARATIGSLAMVFVMGGSMMMKLFPLMGSVLLLFVNARKMSSRIASMMCAFAMALMFSTQVASAQTASESFEGAVTVPPASTASNPQTNFLSNFDFSSSDVDFTIRTPDFVGDATGSPWYKFTDGVSFGVLQAIDNTPKSIQNDGLGINITAAELVADGFVVGDLVTYSFDYAPGYNYDTLGRQSDADTAVAVWVGNGTIPNFASLPATPTNTVLSGAWAPSGTQGGYPVMAAGTWQTFSGTITWTGGMCTLHCKRWKGQQVV